MYDSCHPIQETCENCASKKWFCQMCFIYENMREVHPDYNLQIQNK